MLNGTKVFGTIYELFYRAEGFYHNLHYKLIKLEEKIKKSLSEQKK